MTQHQTDPDVIEAMEVASPNRDEAETPPADDAPKPKELTPIGVNNGKAMMTTHTDVYRMATQVYASSMRIGGADSVDDVFLALMTGLEAGLSITATLKNVMVVNGRPSLWGDAIVSLVYASRECRSLDETFDDDTMTATCRVVRVMQLVDGTFADRETVRTFSKEDAEVAGLWDKRGYNGKPTPWVTHPKRMLQMRARTFAMRDSFADIIGGFSVLEEVDDYVPFDPSQMKSAQGTAAGMIAAAEQSPNGEEGASAGVGG